MASLGLIALLGFTSIRSVAAWGAFGHEAVAYIAQDFVSSATATFVQNILSDTSTRYMANVATWADSYRSTTAGKWSAPLHFMDAMDSPPGSCGVNFARDCPAEGCVVSALTNFTNQLMSSSTSAAAKLDAMKFVIHFVGDMHQPLHVENLDVGGNSIAVTYNSASTNLHSVWDSSLIQEYAGGSSLTVARTFATSTTDAIKAGTWSTTSWLSGTDINDPEATGMKWAGEANGYVCTDVIPDGVAAVQGVDLSGDYYDDHIHAPRIQIARAGYRLAAWLNLIATGKTT
ncbi:S1/P1 nuclease-like protein [Pseudovirgaria hyperparasitica]|uniref:S1/P1 nuclease-like protein n=1 Tax=Pseudovirgaria hyperparasitica TaxID=470096 RepID=A0A6A6W6B3_9PEZI|nr:S1/P1 nuclease-like protein [Pseudovirgaria hyperparasitica]KAF2758085.1 S1/P1 nuclease-like protein [Pseudovirgaria hyperparasitica]